MGYGVRRGRGGLRAREARAVAALVCEDRLGLRFTDVIVEPDAPCPLRDDLQRLAFEIGSYRPAQYIAGFCRFCGRKFSLEEGVLIPPSRNRGARPDDRRAAQERQRPAYSRHRNGERLHSRDAGGELPDARVTAVDISDTALRIARRNAERLRQTVRFERRDILTGPPEGEFDLIVSNPPYVTESEKRQMSPNVLRYEPHRALFVPDDDPLLFYRAIAGLGRRLFAPGGTVYFEINERFGTQTVELLENEGYRRNQSWSKDFFGKPRTVSARWK